MAAFSGSLNFGYALANNNKNTVGSCGEGYLMMNLLLGTVHGRAAQTKSWRIASKLVQRHACSCAKEPTICLRFVAASCLPLKHRSKSKDLTGALWAVSVVWKSLPSSSGQICSHRPWELSTWSTRLFPCLYLRRTVEGCGLAHHYFRCSLFQDHEGTNHHYGHSPRRSNSCRVREWDLDRPLVAVGWLPIPSRLLSNSRGISPPSPWVVNLMNLDRSANARNGSVGIAGTTTPCLSILWSMRTTKEKLLYATQVHKHLFIASEDNPTIRVRHCFE